MKWIAFAMLALVACGDDPTGPRPLTGTYALVSVNGRAVPAPVNVPRSGGAATIFRINEGELRLTDGGSFETSALWAVRIFDGAEFLAVPGTFGVGNFTAEGATIQLARVGESPSNGTVTRDGITIEMAPWGALVFRKGS